MPRNVELKARVRDRARVARDAERLAGGAGRRLVQEDVFFRAPRGRLKLRRAEDGAGGGAQLIFYERADEPGPRLSRYRLSHTDDPAGLAALLSEALGVLGVVRKERLLYLVGQTRVHLDRVDGLGDFMELEVVLNEEQSLQDGEQVARALMEELGVREEDLISGAYLDLLLAQGELQQ